MSNTQETSNTQAYFDWENISDVEVDITDEDEHEFEFDEACNFEESNQNFQQELSSVFFVGAEFKSMDDLRDKAQAIGKQFNCPISTTKSTKNASIILQCRHGGKYRQAKKVAVEESVDGIILINCNYDISKN